MKYLSDVSILGCGWLGEPLAHQLSSQGYFIKGATTSESKLARLSAAGISPFLINLESLSSNVSAFLNAELLIVNLPSKYVEGYKKLIAQIEKSSVKKVVFVSSTSVYENAIGVIMEDAPLKSSPLVEIEKLFKGNTQFKTSIIRFGGLFGYDRKPGNFVGQGKRIENPEGYVNMIHRDDCISIISQIIEKELWQQTLNACADSHPKRREFYTRALLSLGLPLPEFNENTTSGYKLISSKKLKTMLDYEFIYPNLLDMV